MGSVRTEQVKRTAKELLRRFPQEFSTDFEANKQTVNSLLEGVTPKVRNQIAGYITHYLGGEETEETPEQSENQ
ncbi:MAG: 30S ribosomal protein S17e [Candidatus Bathyarchaeota archaeon]|nr:30S ribosomal protein S17e [Candidatus Bathyarchaeota archaeon]